MIHYLSVHDLVWINSTAAGETLAFDYETLEQAMAAQYGYGDSRNVLEQAANLLQTTLTKQPFEYANRRTAYVATLTFLLGNGCALRAGQLEAAEMLKGVAGGAVGAQEAVARIAAPPVPGSDSGQSLRTLVMQLFNQHAEAIQSLAAGDD